MKGKLTKQGKENATETIHSIDEMLDELAYGDKFDFLGKLGEYKFAEGITREKLIARLQAKSLEIQERLKKSGVELPKGVSTKKTIDIIEGEAKEIVNIDETINSIKALEPTDAMKEANKVAGKTGKYENLTDNEVTKILADTEDHIFQKDIKYDEFGEPIKPDPEDFASGGRVGFKKGGIANRNMIATLFE
jgi:hypothetical protein